MKPSIKNSKTLLVPLLAFGILIGGVAQVGALDDASELRALRWASGYYGHVNGTVIPDGVFKGTVNNYYDEHSEMRITARWGVRKSKITLNVWNGADHITKIVGITAKVRAEGRKVRLSGGRVKGKGLLPYGIQVKHCKVIRGTILVSRKPSAKIKMQFAGIDLSDSSRASGKAKFTGDQ